MIKKIKYIKDFFQAFFYIRKHFKKFRIIKVYKTFSNIVVQFKVAEGKFYIFKLFKNQFLYYGNSSFKNSYDIYGKYELTNQKVIAKDSYVIMKFLPNQKNKSNYLVLLAQSFATLHQIPTKRIKEKVNIKALIQYYEGLVKVLPPNLYQKSAKILQKLEKKQKLLVYCHNDFNLDNFVVYNGKSYFIDIEYSGINDIFFELATIKLSLKDEFDKFLNIYLTKNQKHKTFIQGNIESLKQMEYIVLYITFLWFTILENEVETKFYKEKLQSYNIL